MKQGVHWQLSKVVVNPEHITIITEASEVNNLFQEGKIGIGLNEHVVFSKVSFKSFSGFKDLIAVGSPEQILEKIQKKEKTLLKG